MEAIRITRESTIFKVYKSLNRSGEEIAKKLGISRTAVWKAIEKLREFGYVIQSKKGIGYRVISKPEISPVEVADIAFNNLKELVEEVWYYREVDSTNQRAREYSKPKTLFFAESQSAGRGRMGREWFSAKGGLYFSLTLKPELSIEDIPKLTLTTGLAVAKSIPNAKVKWPNDVLLNGKKVCGILCELVGEVEQLIVIVGIGVNVKNPIPKELEDKATNFEAELIDVFDSVTQNLYVHYKMLFKGKWDKIRKEYIENCETIGKFVRVKTISKVYEGFAERIDDDGALVVNGERIYAGECFYIS